MRLTTRKQLARYYARAFLHAFEVEQEPLFADIDRVIEAHEQTPVAFHTLMLSSARIEEKCRGLKVIAEKLGLQTSDRFNIAPQSQVVIKTDTSDHASVHWGIPLEGSGVSRFVTNARFETLDAKPLFRDLARCALLADEIGRAHV